MPSETEKQNMCLYKGYDFNESAKPWQNLVLAHIFMGVVKKCNESNARLASKRGAGLSKAVTVDEPFSPHLDPLG